MPTNLKQMKAVLQVRRPVHTQTRVLLEMRLCCPVPARFDLLATRIVSAVGLVMQDVHTPHHLRQIKLSVPRVLLRCQCAGDFCRDLSTREVVFASVAGLRGSISLIMAQAFVTESAAASADAQVGSCPTTAWVSICQITSGPFVGFTIATFAWYCCDLCLESTDCHHAEQARI